MDMSEPHISTKIKMEKKQEVSPPAEEKNNGGAHRSVDEKGGEKERNTEEAFLPLKSSPYVDHDDLDDYKRKGYGAEGHLEPKPGRGAGATDAPTPSGAGAGAGTAGTGSATDTINRHGVP